MESFQKTSWKVGDKGVGDRSKVYQRRPFCSQRALWEKFRCSKTKSEFDFDVEAQEDWGEIGFTTEDDLSSGEYELKKETESKDTLQTMKEDYEKRMKGYREVNHPSLGQSRQES